MNRKDYNWTPAPKEQQTTPQPKKKSFSVDSISLTPVLWENKIKLGNVNIEMVEIRAIWWWYVSWGSGCNSNFRVSQNCTRIEISETPSVTTSSSTIVNTGSNVARLSKFHKNGIILDFSTVSWTITLQITSY